MKRMMIAGFPRLLCWRWSAPRWLAQDKKTIAFVVNGPSDFWKIMEAASPKPRQICRTSSCSSIYPERAERPSSVA